MEVRTHYIYVAEDGKEFKTEQECINYEKTLIEKEEYKKYYKLGFNPDTGEGMVEFKSSTCICVESLHKGKHLAALDDFLYETLGKRACYFYGNFTQPMDAWRYKETNKEQFNTSPNKLWLKQKQESLHIIDSLGERLSFKAKL